MSGCGYMGLSGLKREKPKEWILPFVRTDLFNRVKASFAQHFGLGKHKRVLLVMDQAGWHTRCPGSGARGHPCDAIAIPFSRASTSRALVAAD